MAAIVNAIDKALQATVPRYTVPTDRGMFVTPASAIFKLSADGTAALPASYTFQVTKLNLPGGVTWSWTEGLSPVVNGDLVTVPIEDFAAVSGQITASITVDGEVYTAVATLTKVADGTQGTVAAYVVVSSTGQVFSRATSAAAFAPASLTLTATPYGGSATYQWQYWTGSAWVNVESGGGSASYAVASGDFANARVYRVQATIGGTVYTDEMTLVQITGGKNGIDAITGFLTNESATLAASNTGVVSSFAGASGSFKVFDGVTDKTGSAVAYSVVSLESCTVGINSAGTYFVSAMSADSASAVLQAVYNGVTIQKVLSLSKSRAGQDGQSVAGQRGNVDIAAVTSSHVWSDSEAVAALAAAGYGAPQNHDLVRLYNSDKTFSIQKAYTTSGWLEVDTVLDGSLFVKKSILAESIDGKGLQIEDEEGNVVFGVNTPIPTRLAAPGTLNSDIVIGGRNLATDSAFDRGMRAWTNKSAATGVCLIEGTPGARKLFIDGGGSPDADVYVDGGGATIPVQAGKQYMLSFEYATATTGTIASSSTYWYTDNGPAVFLPFTPLNTGQVRTRFSMPWTCPDGVTSLSPRFGFHANAYSWMAVFNFDVVEGNASTTWRPAPEDAQTAADAAQVAANAANGVIANISSDNVLTVSEKPQLMQAWGSISDEHQGIANQADALALSRTAYDSAFNTLLANINGISPAYNDLTKDSNTSGANLRANFGAYYLARQTLLNAIAAKAATTANYATVAGRPQDLSNLVMKATFEDGAAGNWASQTVVSVSGQSFTKALQFATRDTVENGDGFALNPGETIYISGWLDASTSNFDIAFGVYMAQAGGAQNWAGATVPKGTGFTYVSIPLVIPAGYIRGYPWLQINGGSNFGSARAAGLRISRYQPGATVGATWGGNIDGQPRDDQIMNALQQWAQILGAGKPQDGATVGATIGQNLFGQMTAANISTYIAAAAIDLALINRASIGNLAAMSAVIGLLRTATSGARIEIADNLIVGYRSNNTMAYKISA